MFADVPPQHPFFFDVAVVHRLGVMTGDVGGEFGIDYTINRAAGAMILSRMNQRLEERGITELLGFDGEAHEG